MTETSDIGAPASPRIVSGREDSISRIAEGNVPGSLGQATVELVRRIFGKRTPAIDKIAMVSVVIIVLLGIVAPLAMPYDPLLTNPSKSLQPPGGDYLLGTDVYGRDILSRIMAGAAQTLLASFVVVLLANLIGVIVAAIAAVSPKWLDEAIMRGCDIFMSLPSLVLALGLAAALGPSLTSIMIAMIVALWPSTARLARAAMRETMTSTYVESARVLGMSKWRLLIKHILPNSLDAIYVHASMEISGTIVMMAGLAFLGVGAPPPSPDWGSMIAEGQEYITTAWWIALFPGVAITVGAIIFGLSGDAVRGMVDPESRR